MRYESNYEKYYGIDPYNPGNTLKQHGVIGMKWGVWNEETRARRLRDRRRGSSSDNSSSKSNSRPKSEIGGLFNRGSKRIENEDLSTLSEEEKKKIDKKYFKESSYSIKTRVMDENGRYTDKWITKQYKTYALDGKKIIKDIGDNFYKEIDEEKKKYNDYEAKHLTEKKWVKALDDYWYGHDFSLNMFPVYLTKNEFKKEMEDHWAKGMDESTVNRIYDYMVEKTKYADKIESICENELKRLGVSNSTLNSGKWALYGAFVDNSKSNSEIVKDINNFSHSDNSSDFYYATEPYDPRTTAKQHGVKGQKWGVWNEETRARRLRDRRRKGNSQASVIGSNNNIFNKIKNSFSKNKSEEPPHLKRTHLTKELAEISDAELNAAIKRMQLEQTYLQMLKNYPDSSDKGKKYADQFTDQLFNSLSNGLGGAMGRRIAKAIDSWFDDDSAEKEKRKKYEAEAKRKSDDEIKKRNARDAIVNQYVTNRLNEDKNK